MGKGWQEKAACAAPGVDPDTFFASVEGHAPRGWEKEAKMVCAKCQVVRECMNLALEHAISDGVWGGLTGWERYSMGGARPRSGKSAKREATALREKASDS
ncbi:WhiB family transcriptional regulator [Streptomyces sp. SKN60]|uniref:WhiB family transcriptional regulator n=1 Tax=Streptomyces sp. SKN60 TaxID=2855506 RepID=UPI0022453549|nr:WhiB family transcriptional regulator [Streptomyces sp. SKN60]MCX2184997.1 WhiB family transcriptional regulator [Streptomyces sp. SKN60]